MKGLTFNDANCHLLCSLSIDWNIAHCILVVAIK